MQLLVTDGDGHVWVIRPDLTSKVLVSNPTDLNALNASGQYVNITLDQVQVNAIPTVG
jgi:hypothetical protein